MTQLGPHLHEDLAGRHIPRPAVPILFPSTPYLGKLGNLEDDVTAVLRGIVALTSK